MAFRDEDIEAIVSTGKFSDPKAAAYLAECLRMRCDKIGKAYYAKVLPLDRFRIEDGKLAWDDLGKASSIGGVEASVAWHRFDNSTGTKARLESAGGLSVPGGNEYVAAEISSPSRSKQTVTVYLRTRGGSPQVVGIDRGW